MRKKIKKVIKKRPQKRGRKPKNIITDLELFYKFINKVQINNVTVSVLISFLDAAVYDNILKDLDLIYVKKKSKNKDFMIYKISPNPKKIDTVDFENLENLPDEFFEDGQLFGI